ncbi:hypothetical protein AVEN_95956-1 [Araneus ventricosus]|uniref:Uncharacterized protein n=1 Tax=Araneus ventricosus TaxID=182803 RepID=A0A4Y2AUU0_ARAVE|nr:hypothetical protein AVEN_95956-1 [Araneus ventricosus]
MSEHVSISLLCICHLYAEFDEANANNDVEAMAEIQSRFASLKPRRYLLENDSEVSEGSDEDSEGSDEDSDSSDEDQDSSDEEDGGGVSMSNLIILGIDANLH